MGMYGPSGGTGGQFTQGISDTAGVTRIRVWSGEYVNAIQLSYQDAQILVFGNANTAALTGDFFLEAGESVTAIAGNCGEFVDSITITTSLPRSLTFGGGGGSTPYSYTADTGGEIIGFWGRQGDWIDAIGVFTQLH